MEANVQSGILASFFVALTVSLPGDAVCGLTSTPVNKQRHFQAEKTGDITLWYGRAVTGCYRHVQSFMYGWGCLFLCRLLIQTNHKAAPAWKTSWDGVIGDVNTGFKMAVSPSCGGLPVQQHLSSS